MDHRAHALQLALAIRARGDVSFGRGNLARRQGLQGVGARQLGPFATVQVSARAHWPMVEFPPRPDTECRQAGFATGEFDGCRNLTAVEFIDCRM
jgi:hypothetical protein